MVNVIHFLKSEITKNKWVLCISYDNGDKVSAAYIMPDDIAESFKSYEAKENYALMRCVNGLSIELYKYQKKLNSN